MIWRRSARRSKNAEEMDPSDRPLKPTHAIMEPGIIAEYTAFGGGVRVQEHDFRTLSLSAMSMSRMAVMRWVGVHNHTVNGFNTTYKVVVMSEV